LYQPKTKICNVFESFKAFFKDNFKNSCSSRGFGVQFKEKLSSVSDEMLNENI